MHQFDEVNLGSQLHQIRSLPSSEKVHYFDIRLCCCYMVEVGYDNRKVLIGTNCIHRPRNPVSVLKLNKTRYQQFFSNRILKSNIAKAVNRWWFCVNFNDIRIEVYTSRSTSERLFKTRLYAKRDISF